MDIFHNLRATTGGLGLSYSGINVLTDKMYKTSNHNKQAYTTMQHNESLWANCTYISLHWPRPTKY
jgi:hypothetical protein